MKKTTLQKIIERNGPVYNPGRFFPASVFALALTLLFGACTDKEPVRPEPELITFQNQMRPDFYAYVFDKIRNNQPKKNMTDVWGVAVPHHQLAADVMAQTLFQLKDNDYENIYILSPDHFDRGNTQISFTKSRLKTGTGITQISDEDIETLKGMNKTGSGDDFISFEHGVGTPIPFIVSLWPKARITPILIRSDAKKNDLEELIQFLSIRITRPKTLIVESSDFSHYLAPEKAHQKDLQTIDTLKQDDPGKILDLNQPDNCDSINILYIMKKLQTINNARLDIYLNKNSQDYTKEKVTSSTSYITFFISH